MAEASNLSQWLHSTLVFRGLSPSELIPLAQIAQLQTFSKGELIFKQGSEATGFFVIKSGRVKVFKVSSSGKEQILHLFGAREYFAEVAALDGKSFPAFAAAIEASELVFFPRLAFLDLLYQYPAISINLLMSLSTHLRRLAQLIENLSFKDVPQRLAEYLLDLSERENRAEIVTLNLTKSQLAATLGTIPATLSRAFYRLSSERMITINGPQIRLLDRDRLQNLSQLSELEANSQSPSNWV